jgi:hypothetical protein
MPSHSSHNATTGKVRIPEGFVVPEPKPLRVADGNYYGSLTSLLAACVRGTNGVFVSGWRPYSKRPELWPGTLGILRDGSATLDSFRRPAGPLVLHDNEADAHCRLVREACSLLDLTLEVRPRSGGEAGAVFFQDGAVQHTSAAGAIEHLFDQCKATRMVKSGH